MKPKLIALFLLIVLVPLGLLTWLGLRVAHDEQEIVEHKFRELLVGKLRDVDAAVAGFLEERERQLLALTDLSHYDVPSLRKLVQSTPFIEQVFVLGPDGKRLYPSPDGPLNSSERGFLARAGQVWQDRQAFYRPPETPGSSAPRSHGWYVWYWGSGLNVLFWRRAPGGHVIGAELSRMRLLADIVGRLPDTDPLHPSVADGRLALADGTGDAVYQWGAYEPREGEKPQAAVALSPPLNAWTLEYYASSAELRKALGGGLLLTLVSGLVAAGVALAGFSVYLYRETSREVREAAQRVHFVNQVSHELKTPLTNIRLYAELLEGGLGDDEERRARYLGVIVSESQRLSRLIGNVLAFARKHRGKLTLHPAPGCIDDHVASVLQDFRASLEAKGVEVAFSAGAPATVRFDPDALEQILGNLVSNVEKYAATGGHMGVATRQNGGTTTLEVADRGPGIPKGQEESIFRPFHRLSNRLTDGVTGTGIGLSIARDLARLHGGGIALVPSEAGARFQVVLHTPPQD